MSNQHYQIPTTQPQTNLAALTDTEILLVEEFQSRRELRSLLLPSTLQEPMALLEHLWQTGLSTVWVLPATTLSRDLTSSWFERVKERWMLILHTHPDDADKPISALLWPRGNQQGRRLTFAFPEWAGWGWILADTRSLLATVTYLNQILAQQVIDSPDVLAHHLLSKYAHTASSQWLPTSARGESEQNDVVKMEPAKDLEWMRPFTLVEERQKYLHKYSHFSWDLEACRGVLLGAGSPQHSATGRAYDGLRPGLWRTQIERAGSLFDGKRLPDSLDAEWMSTPQVQCCRDIGYQVQVREGYFWPEFHEGLTGWATMLWQAAERLQRHPQTYRHQEGKVNALRTLTLLAQRGIAILGEVETTREWFRPGWQAQIFGRRRAILFAHLAELVRQGTMPVLLEKDAFWVISNDPNPLTAVPGLVTARRWKGYSVGTQAPLPLSREVRAAFRTAEQPGKTIYLLNRLASELSLEAI